MVNKFIQSIAARKGANRSKTNAGGLLLFAIMGRGQVAASLLLLFATTLSGGSCARKSDNSLDLLLISFLLKGSRSIHIIGDSLTHYSNGFYLEDELEPSDEFHYIGIPGSDFLEWSIRIDEALEAAGKNAPDVLFVPLGTNEGYYTNPDSFLSHFRDFHKELRLRSSARVYYFQVPRTMDPTISDSIIENNSVLEKNLPRDGVGLIDMDTIFQGHNTNTLYPPDDPIHPSDFGYGLFASEILKRL